jgi:Na+/phosphate symporter
MIETGDFNGVDKLLVDGNALKSQLSQIRHQQQDRLQQEDANIKSALLYLNTLQEMQELVSMTRHLLRAAKRFRA